MGGSAGDFLKLFRPHTLIRCLHHLPVIALLSRFGVRWRVLRRHVRLGAAPVDQRQQSALLRSLAVFDHRLYPGVRLVSRNALGPLPEPHLARASIYRRCARLCPAAPSARAPRQSESQQRRAQDGHRSGWREEQEALRPAARRRW
ncbi:hypothetical protein L1887_51852 [Cichorium endivia]|nr:hypothetical protein L1887_51852 [Cichorium endivia]